MRKLSTKKKKEIEKDIEIVAPPKAQSQKLVQEFIGLFFLLLGALILLSLVSYSPADPTFNKSISQNVAIINKAGLVGAYLSALLVDLFGLGSYVWVIFFIGLGGGFITKWLLVAWWRFLGYILFGVSLISLASAWSIEVHTIIGGGLFGDYLYQQGLLYFSPIGFGFIWTFVLLFATKLIFGISWLGYIQAAFAKIGSLLAPTPKEDLLSEEKEESFVVISEPYSEDSAKPAKKRSFLSSFGKKKKNASEDAQNNSLDVSENTLDEGKATKDLFNFNNPPVLKFDDETVDEEFRDDEFLDDEITDLEFSEITEPKNEKKKKDWSPFSKKKNDSKNEKEKTIEVKSNDKNFSLPSTTLLAVTPATDIQVNKKALDEKGLALIQALSEFNIEAKLCKITPGPVVTMFEVRPAAGIRVNKILNLSNDLAMTLKAIRIRIQAPIPGSDTVGIEIPNETRANVSFRELLEGTSFKNATSLLSIALGKNIGGQPFTADLSTMPHLLVAGATGAGKSVCLNTIILSFLYKAKPDEVKLLLIDPKRIELAIYQDLPHLVHPVITEMQLAKNALLWAVDEMERRFKLLEDLKVRNLADYNAKVEKLPPQEPNEPDYYDENGNIVVTEKKIIHERLPRFVIIIDELADLMQTHGKDVELSIVRIGQKARAAGIHMILATQRPSVDVVTGLIKTNCPGRISFKVTQTVDSRTILDSAGAETLLGKGDMLFRGSAGTLDRYHGAFVPDEDVEKVIQFWKNQAKPDYSVDFSAYEEEKVSASESSGRNDISQEPIYQEAINILPTMEKVSISAIQRRLRVGFNKAALIKEQLEKDGYIAH